MTKSKLIHLLEMLGKEAELGKGRLQSEVNGFVHEDPMDEVTTYVQPAESRGMETGIAVVDDIVILHKLKSNAYNEVRLQGQRSDLYETHNETGIKLTL